MPTRPITERERRARVEILRRWRVFHATLRRDRDREADTGCLAKADMLNGMIVLAKREIDDLQRGLTS